MSDLQKHRDILGVDANANAQAIRKSFFVKAKEFHPDKRPQDESPEDREAAKANFLAVHRAYEALLEGERKIDEAADGQRQAPSDILSSFAGCDEDLAEARAARSEAEAYVNELFGELRVKDSDPDLKTGTTVFSPEEEEAIRSIWRKAFRAVEELRKREISAEGRVQNRDEFQKAVLRNQEEQQARKPNTTRAVASVEPPLNGASAGLVEIMEDMSGAAQNLLDGTWNSWYRLRTRWGQELFGISPNIIEVKRDEVCQ